MRPVWLPDIHNQDSDHHPPRPVMECDEGYLSEGGPVAQPFLPQENDMMMTINNMEHGKDTSR